MKATYTLMFILTAVAVLLFIFLFVLLFQPKERNKDVERTEDPPTETASSPNATTTTEPVLPVPQANSREDLPLGSDLNMEFPTLEE